MRRGLQILLAITGSIMLVAGTLTVIFGAATIPSATITPSVDSELRFFGVWYAAAGLVVLRVVDQVEAAGTTIRAVAAAFLVAGSARLVSLAVVGRPHVSQLVLMTIELVLPAVMVPWQFVVSRKSSAATRSNPR